MEIVGYSVYGLAVIVAFIWMVGIRNYTISGKGVVMSTVNTTMLFFVSLLAIPIFQLSPFHLFWMYPLSFLLGMMSLASPFSILSILGKFVFSIACFGLNREEVERNTERVRRGVELVNREGLSVEEAKKRLEEEGY